MKSTKKKNGKGSVYMNDEDIKVLEVLKETLMKDKFIIPKEPKKWCEAIENLLNRNKELEEENKELKENLKIATAMLTKSTYPSKNEEGNDFKKQFIPASKIKERYEKNKARTDCRYCNNTCDSYAVCMFCKELLEGK